MQLVVLAAGHGRRFGGLKQLAPVGPNGEAIMDYTAATAKDCGYEGLVLVIREDIEQEICQHVEQYFPAGLKVDFAFQGPRRGTAEAVASAASWITGPFAVANADDLYSADALGAIHASFSPGGIAATRGSHVLVGYRLVRTVLTACPVTRGLIEVSPEGSLECIVEHTVRLRDDGSFQAWPLGDASRSRILTGNEPVSMNLWGFAPRILDDLEEALSCGDFESSELLLPDVVGALVTSGRDEVTVLATASRCIGITSPEDLALVQDELAVAEAVRTTPQH